MSETPERLIDDTRERKEIKRLRRECCSVRLKLRAAEREAERLKTVEAAFERISTALSAKARS